MLTQTTTNNAQPNSVATMQLISLTTFNGAWTQNEAAHLIRRTHFGLNRADLNNALSQGSASSAVDAIVEKALTTATPDTPTWVENGPSSDIQDMYSIQFEWMDRMVRDGLLERMKLFWSNHFAVGYNNMNALHIKARRSYANHMFYYLRDIQHYAMGDFKALVKVISKSPAMLYYLNNYVNSKDGPNEDFARELLELFTLGPNNKLGEPNYSETDVSEIARAVTGWKVNEITREAVFVSRDHDASEKTIFGQTAQFDLDGVIDLIFETKGAEMAWFICKKLYVYYVSAEPNNQVIENLASTFLASGFKISEVLKVLFKSAHFYEDELIGCRLKSPIELFMGHLRELEISPDDARKNFIRLQMQQNSNEELLRPTTVFGWDGYNPPKSDNIPGHFAWLNTNYLPIRWQSLSDLILVNREGISPFSTIRLTENLSDPTDPLKIAKDLAKHLLAIPLEQADISLVEEDFAGDPAFRPDTSGLTDKEISLAKILLGPIPWYEWSVQTNPSGALSYNRIFDYRIRNYLVYLIQLPAYQLI